MKNILFLCCVVLLSGCSATKMVAKRGGSTSPYAPANEKELAGGTIRFLNQGTKSIKEKRREDAYKQMHDHCQGAYKITQEYPRSEGGDSIPTQFGVINESTEYWYIDFQCAPESVKN